MVKDTLAGINTVMKKTLLTFFCFLAFVLSTSAAQWPRVEIAKIVSLGFPALPNVSATGDLTNYLCLTDSFSCLVQTKAYKEGGKVHDSVTLVAFYDGMVKGMVKGAKGTFVRKDSVVVAGFKGVEVEYVKSDEQSLPVTVCSRTLLINDLLLVYSFTAPSGRYDGMKAMRNKFFSSIAFNKDSSVIQYHPKGAVDSSSVTTSPMVTAVPDSSKRNNSLHTDFMHSHAGDVMRMFGLLILFSVIVYFLAILSRRKG